MVAQTGARVEFLLQMRQAGYGDFVRLRKMPDHLERANFSAAIWGKRKAMADV
jgi:hypothetical protein